jgi:hypothetical protein
MRPRNLWRLIGSSSAGAVLPVITVVLFGTIVFAPQFGAFGIGVSVGTASVLLWLAVRAMTARVVVEGSELVFESLIGRQRISMVSARLSTLEDVSFGSRLLGLVLDGRPFYRQLLALFTESEWNDLIDEGSSGTMMRAESLWSALRRRG